MSARLFAAVVIEDMFEPTFVTLVSLASTKFIFVLFALTALILVSLLLTATIAELFEDTLEISVSIPAVAFIFAMLVAVVFTLAIDPATVPIVFEPLRSAATVFTLA